LRKVYDKTSIMECELCALHYDEIVYYVIFKVRSKLMFYKKCII